MPRTPRVLRALVAAAAALVAVVALAGCRTDPGVAAYVGEDRISVSQLQSAIDQRMADPAVAAAAKGKEAEFSRLVLSRLVDQRVYAAVVDHYGLQVTDEQVNSRLALLLGSEDPAQVYQQLAAQGIARDDVFENVRQQVIRQQLAARDGLTGGLTEQALQARYAQERDSLAEVNLGYITVPDQATATAVLAQLTANPSAYPTLAAQHAGTYTLPQVQPHPRDQIPQPLADAAAKAAPNTGFTVAVPQTGGVVVGFVTGLTYPSYASVRPQLIQEVTSAIDQKANPDVAKVRSGLEITVNPRYGVLKNGQVVPESGGVVDILGSTGASGS